MSHTYAQNVIHVVFSTKAQNSGTTHAYAERQELIRLRDATREAISRECRRTNPVASGDHDLVKNSTLRK